MASLDKKTELGIIGEKIVRNFFTAKKFVITDSLSVYDSTQDFTAEYNDKKYTVEVKTQMPFVKEKSFTILPNQQKKCFSVDILIFVGVPDKHNSGYGGKIYKVDTKTASTSTYKTKDGRNMILIPIEQSSVKAIHTLTQQEISLLKNATSSIY